MLLSSFSTLSPAVARPLLPSLAAARASPLHASAANLQKRRTQLLSELADVNRALEAEAAYQKASGIPIALGSRTSAFEPSFGYLSRSAGVYTEALSEDGNNLPSSAFDLATKNFQRELVELRKTLSGTSEAACASCTPEAVAVRAKLDALVLSNDAVWDRERKREAAGGKVDSPLVLLIPYYALCWCLDVFFEDRPLARFWFLETVARMPYFAYVSALHLYESLGWWRRSSETKRVHFAEEWNEFHHLLTMEALGGDQRWQDRFLAQHAAIVYYWLLVALWLLSPSLSYNFSELIEAHAVDTYGEFVDANRDALAELPAPSVTRQYYNGPDLFLFDEFQTSRARGSRRPPCETLLDVFTNIRDDEGEHVATMKACQDPNVAVVAPRIERAILGAAAVGVIAAGLLSTGVDLTAVDLDTLQGAIDALDATDVAVDVAEFGLAGLAGPEVIFGKGGLEAFKGFASAIRSALGSLPKLDVAAVGESVTTATEALREGAREGIEALSDFIAERFSGPPRQ